MSILKKIFLGIYLALTATAAFAGGGMSKGEKGDGPRSTEGPGDHRARASE